MDFTAVFKKERRHIWLIAALYVLGGGYVASVLGYIGHGFPYGIFVGIVLLAAAVWLTLRHRKTAVNIDPDFEDQIPSTKGVL